LETIESQLIKYLKESGDWEQMETPILGVYVVKAPGTKSRLARLFLELNPQKNGKPIKRKGLFLDSVENLQLFIQLLSDEKVEKILEHIENINSKFEKPTKKRKLVMNT